MVRDNSFEGLFRLMGYTGTPMLWHLSIWPLVKSGLPYASMGILNACLAIGTAAIVLLLAPLSLPMRTLILFSYLDLMFLYFNVQNIPIDCSRY